MSIGYNRSMKQVILASTSPRRYQLLHSLGFEIEIFAPNVDETPLESEKPDHMVMRLAKLKANAVVSNSKLPIIAADTTVCLGTEMFGKPTDLQDAVRMLSTLSGKEHQVLTGYAVRLGIKEIVNYVTTTVSFRALSLDEIEAYVHTGEPLDKAGSYGIQGLGACLIDHLQGSYTNVMGLPLKEILASLSELKETK